jgi:hypothetical protein
MGELSCIAQACLACVSLSLIFLSDLSLDLFPVLCLDPCEVVPVRAFYSSRSGNYNETRGPTGGPQVAETLYNI